jgi:RNA polymerase sigma factor (sigma-70 family)
MLANDKFSVQLWVISGGGFLRSAGGRLASGQDTLGHRGSLFFQKSGRPVAARGGCGGQGKQKRFQFSRAIRLAGDTTINRTMRNHPSDDHAASDAELLAAWVTRRDSDAMGTLVERYQALVLAVCLRQCRRRVDVEDAYQATFLQLSRSAEKIRNPAALPGWLQSVAHRIAVRTRKIYECVPLDAVHLPSEEFPLQQIARRHELQLLDEELDALGQGDRSLLAMHYLDGQSVGEMAGRLNSTVGSVRGKLQRARQRLRGRMLRRGVGLPAALAACEGLPTGVVDAAELSARAVQRCVADGRVVGDGSTLSQPSEPANAELEHLFSGGGKLTMTTSTTAILSMVAALTLYCGLQPTNLRNEAAGQASLKLAGAPLAADPAVITTPLASDPVLSVATSGVPNDQPNQATDDASEDPFGDEGFGKEPSGGDDPFVGQASGGNPFGGGPAGGGQAGGAGPGADPFGGSAAGGGGFEGGFGDGGFGDGGFGGGGLGGGRSAGPVVDQNKAVAKARSGAIPELSPFERDLVKQLGEPTDLVINRLELTQLPSLLSDRLGIPVILDTASLSAAEIESDLKLDANVSKTTLRALLHTVLHPHGLRAVVENDMVNITVDADALALAGGTTAMWVNIDNDQANQILDTLQQVISIEMVEVPLEEAAREIQLGNQLPIAIDRRALEDIGLSADVPVSVQAADQPLQNLLQIMLDPLDLTLTIRNDRLVITTRDEYRGNRLIRSYWLDGTGLTDANAAMELIQTMIIPDDWELMGGPNTLTSLEDRQNGRVALFAAATLEAHLQLEQLLETLRANQRRVRSKLSPVETLMQGFGAGSSATGINMGFGGGGF